MKKGSTDNTVYYPYKVESITKSIYVCSAVYILYNCHLLLVCLSVYFPSLCVFISLAHSASYVVLISSRSVYISSYLCMYVCMPPPQHPSSFLRPSHLPLVLFPEPLQTLPSSSLLKLLLSHFLFSHIIQTGNKKRSYVLDHKNFRYQYFQACCYH